MQTFSISGWHYLGLLYASTNIVGFSCDKCLQDLHIFLVFRLQYFFLPVSLLGTQTSFNLQLLYLFSALPFLYSKLYCWFVPCIFLGLFIQTIWFDHSFLYVLDLCQQRRIFLLRSFVCIAGFYWIRYLGLVFPAVCLPDRSYKSHQLLKLAVLFV